MKILANFYKQNIKVACGSGAENIYVTTKPTPTTGWLVINPSNTSKREIVKYSATGTDGTGDYVTIASADDRGLGGTSAQAHNIGETIRMNITAEHWADIYVDPIFTGTVTVPVLPVADTEAASKKYADDLAIAGSPNMTLTVKGIAEEATAAEINAGTQVGGTSAELAVNPKFLKDSEYYTQRPTADEKAALAGTGTPSSANKYVTADTDALKELLANKDTTVTLGISDTNYPSQNAVKTYVDATHLGSVYSTASESLKASANTSRQTDADGYTKLKEVRINFYGSYTVKFTLANSDAAYAGCYGRIYVNDAAVGTERNNDTVTPIEYSQDFTLNAGDKISIYAKQTNGTAAKYAIVTNFRIYYNLTYTSNSFNIITD